MDKASTIACVILTLNESQDLPRSLRSISWCDELIVVDSGSKDSTYQVSQQYGARFLEHIQSSPFLITEQRNWALTSAGISSEWVLFLDADEEVSSELAHEIVSVIDSPTAFDAYELTPRYWFLGKWLKRTQGYPNWHPRLVRRGSAYFEGGVWESFEDGICVGRLRTPYEHYAFSKGLDDWLERHRRYANFDAQIIADHLLNRSPSLPLTKRWRYLRLVMSNLWFLRPPLRFAQKFILQFGILEGWQALIFSLLMSFYDLMVVIKVIELLRRNRGLSL